MSSPDGGEPGLIEVVVTSPETAELEVAELWVGGEQLAETRLLDGTVRLWILPRRDGQAWVVGAADMRHSLERARDLLSRL